MFPSEFMRRYTDFKSIDDMADASGWKIESVKDFEAIPDAEWGAFAKTRTRFENWEEMQSKAAEEYATRRLGL